jgi:hypothetical protein
VLERFAQLNLHPVSREHVVRQEQQHRLGRRNLLLQQVDVLRALGVQEHL